MHAHACTGMWSQHRSSVNVMQMLRLAHPTSRMHARTAVLHVPTRCRPKRYTMHAVYIHTIYIYIHVCVYIYIHIRTYMRVCKYNYAHLYIHAGVVDSTDVEYTHATGTVHSHGRICREKRSIVKQCGNTSACKAPMYANTNKVPEIQAGGVYMCWCICLRNMSGSANHLYEHTCMHVHSTAMCSPIVAKTGNISMKCRAL